MGKIKLRNKLTVTEESTHKQPHYKKKVTCSLLEKYNSFSIDLIYFERQIS